ncbi:MAG TPA: 3-phosphoserine/phosphohydroxythreonine transaminase [Candidatus Aphodovivens excrementavium]|nr:3-phosphoserine/phosphohydroxythreonine transaminase [Candidatus Aphodovivens excrementavium]
MGRVYNFSAGPAVLPEDVLRQAATDMLDYQGCGMSVMEMSHRSKEFGRIIEEAEADLRSLAGIPDTYKVLFLQGGASSQFAAVPLNLMKPKADGATGRADYIITGSWGKKAWKEAQLYGDAHVAASTEQEGYTRVPKQDELSLSPDADYVYICENETIYGVKFPELPDTGSVPLVADVSSCFLSEPFDIEKYGVMYGGVQKNIGPAGTVIAIIREDLIRDDVVPGCPTMLKWKTQADANSLYNTPPTWGIYICGLVFKWIIAQGGLSELQTRNRRKAALLYDYLDQSSLFKATVAKEDRSIMNVPFVTGDADLDAKFVSQAKEAGIVNIKGHRSVGGMRASIYNAMPEEGVRALISFMEKFERENA